MTREQQMQDMMTAAFWRDIEEGNQPDNGDAIEIAKTYERAYQQGWRDADQHPQWIPVEERLPEKDNEFEDFSKLVIVTNGKDFWKGMYNYGGEDWRTFDLWLIDDATHWMEIVPPQGK